MVGPENLPVDCCNRNRLPTVINCPALESDPGRLPLEQPSNRPRNRVVLLRLPFCFPAPLLQTFPVPLIRQIIGVIVRANAARRTDSFGSRLVFLTKFSMGQGA